MLRRFEVRTSTYGLFSVRYRSIVQLKNLQNYYSYTILNYLSTPKLIIKKVVAIPSLPQNLNIKKKEIKKIKSEGYSLFTSP